MGYEAVVYRWGVRVISSIMLGVFEAAFYYIIFAVLFPSLLEQLYYQLGQEPPPAGYARSPFIIAAITAVFVVARILYGTPLSPVFRAAGILLSLNIAIASVGGELVVGVNGLEISDGVYLDAELDITPIYAAALFFLVFPSIIGLFIDYYLREASR